MCPCVYVCVILFLFAGIVTVRILKTEKHRQEYLLALILSKGEMLCSESKQTCSIAILQISTE